MKSYIRNIGFFLILLILALGCKKDDDSNPHCEDPGNPECPDYDPCFSENPVSAQFRMYDDLFFAGLNSDLWFEDSILYNGRIRFKATEKDAYYKWYLGQEIIEGFGDSIIIKTIYNLEPGIYPASLVVEKEPNEFCFPNDIGRDSTFRQFEVKNVCDLLVMNKFKGVFESNPTDSLVIEFFPFEFGPGNDGILPTCENFYSMAGINLDGLNDTLSFPNSLSTFALLDKLWVQNDTGTIPAAVGTFEVYQDGTCNGQYRLNGQDYIFTGKLLM